MLMYTEGFVDFGWRAHEDCSRCQTSLKAACDAIAATPRIDKKIFLAFWSLSSSSSSSSSANTRQFGVGQIGVS